MTYPPADDRLRHLLAQRINCHVDTWKLAFFIAGAIVDTLLFLTLAGFPVTAATVGGQLVGKLAWATALPVAVVLTIRQVRRAVPRHSLGA